MVTFCELSTFYWDLFLGSHSEVSCVEGGIILHEVTIHSFFFFIGLKNGARMHQIWQQEFIVS